MLTVAVVALSVGFISCKKDYTCTCTWDDGVTAGTQTTDIEIKDEKKSDAEDICDAAQATYRVIDSGATCNLKS